MVVFLIIYSHHRFSHWVVYWSLALWQLTGEGYLRRVLGPRWEYAACNYTIIPSKQSKARKAIFMYWDEPWWVNGKGKWREGTGWDDFGDPSVASQITPFLCCFQKHYLMEKEDSRATLLPDILLFSLRQEAMIGPAHKNSFSSKSLLERGTKQYGADCK